MKANRKILGYAAGVLFLYLLYYGWFILYIPTGKMDIANIFIFVVSLLLVVFGVHLLKKEFSITGFFLVTYFLTLAVNNLNLNIYQEYKTFQDMYFFFGGGILFAAVTSIRFKKLVKIPSFGFDIQWVAIGISLLYIALQVRIFMETGIRFVSDEWSSIYSDNYVIPGLSGVTEVLRWCSLMFIADSKNKYYKIFFVLSAIIATILNAKRGDAMRILIFLGVLYFYKIDYSQKKKIMLKIIASILAILCIHSGWGAYREMKRGASEYAVVHHNKRNITNNEFIRWVYGYSAMSFETLKQAYIENPYENNFGIGALKSPFIRITGGNEAILEEEAKYHDISMRGGANAATFLCRFVKDGGYFFFVGVTILGIYIAFLESICRSNQLVGGHAFLLMLTFISQFGNYYVYPSYFYAIHLYIVFALLLSKKPLKEKEDVFQTINQ